MIKLLIFDLDGVLVDSTDIHFNALNIALEEIDKKYIITKDEHISLYNGLNTKTKLKILTEKKGLDISTYNHIYNRKQELTKEMFEKVKKSLEKYNLLKYFKNKGYKLHCASNCIKETLLLILENLGIKDLFDYILSNEDVVNCKPSGEIFLKCMIKENISSQECIIFEDSSIGLESAKNSGANICYIKSSEYLTIDKINQSIKYYENDDIILKKTCFMKDINIIIPMAGNGSRFIEAGYKNPKPLINVNNVPMITKVIKNIGIDGKYIFIIKENDSYIEPLLKSLVNNCEIIKIKDTTDGAACTVLLAELYINNNPLLIANCDQYLEWDPTQFFIDFLVKNKHLDSVISTFHCPDKNPKWSFAKLNKDNYVCEIKEKEAISDIATTGIYLWRDGKDFVKFAKQMIQKNIRHNNEFYVAPVFNEAILNNKKIGISHCKKMWGLGTPVDLEYFLNNFKLF